VVLAVAVVAAVYLGLLPKVVDVRQVGRRCEAMTWLELATLLAARVWNLVSYLLPQLAATPGLSLRRPPWRATPRPRSGTCCRPARRSAWA
jgi:hypothetical protein